MASLEHEMERQMREGQFGLGNKPASETVAHPGIITADTLRGPKADKVVVDSVQDDYSSLVEAAKEQLYNAKNWNKTQLLKLAKAFLGPFARVRGSDDTQVYVYLEKNGVSTRLGTGKAKDGKGAYLDAFMNTFIKPLEAKLKMQEETRRQAKISADKASELVKEMKSGFEATLNNAESTEEAKQEAGAALKNLEENLKRIELGQLKLDQTNAAAINVEDKND